MKHAVLAQTGRSDCYGIINSDVCVDIFDPSVFSLFQDMQNYHIDVLWAMPGCQLSNVVRAEHFLELGNKYHPYVPDDYKEGKPIYGAKLRLQGDRLNRFFMFPGNREWKNPQNHDKGVWYCPEPEHLLMTIDYLELEYPATACLWCPSYMGMETLKNIHQGQGVEIVPQSPADTKWFLQNVARDCCNSVAWANLHTLGSHIIGYDKNGQFPGAAGSVELANGSYRRMKTYDPDKSGFWHFTMVGNRGYFDGNKLPIPIDRMGGWAHTDLVECCLKAGILLKIDQGIVPQQQGKYLEQWAKSMWKHRTNLKTLPRYDDVIARSNAVGTSKMITNTVPGRFAHESSGNYYRPDWNRGIVHRALANQMYSLARIHREFGITPVLVSKDSFYIVTDTDDPNQAIPGILDHQHEQRGYKAIGVCPLTAEIIQAFSRKDDKRFGVAGIEGTIRRTMQNGTA